MANLIFNKFGKSMGDNLIDMDNHTFNCLLLTDAYTPDATDALLADLGQIGPPAISTIEASGAGYTTRGQILTTVTWNEAAGTVTFDADNPSWTSATFTCRYAVIFDDTAAGDPLVCLYDFGSDQSVSNGTFTIQWNNSGIISLS
jgi:hypothetical protein